MKSEVSARTGLLQRWHWRRLSVSVVAIASAAAVSLGTAVGAAAQTRAAHVSVPGAVAKQLQTFESTVSSYALPKRSLKDPSKLRGKTIEYIPVSSAVPEFSQIVAPALRKAVSAVGAKLSVCSDPAASPTEWNACFSQAVGQKDAAIILDAAPWQVVATQIPAALKAGVQVQVDDQVKSTIPGTGWVFGASGIIQSAVADWIIQDSGGKANVLINEDTDGPSPPLYINNYALPTFKKYCHSCSTSVQTISTANINQVASQTSSALLKDPSTNYVYSEFDQFLQTTEEGVQSANDLSKVKGVSTTGLVAGLELMKKKQYLYADASIDFSYQAWAEADLAFRQILGMPLVNVSVPMRLFTRQNVGTVALTQAAQDNGSWFGPTTFVASFKKLWGVK